VRPLIVAIPRFIQMDTPLPPLKLMAQSRLVYPLSVGAPVLPEYEPPHVVIEPSALRAAKACEFEDLFNSVCLCRP
jgi:hypothetical protein